MFPLMQSSFFGFDKAPYSLLRSLPLVSYQLWKVLFSVHKVLSYTH